jgi:leucyl aminopeptidase
MTSVRTESNTLKNIKSDLLTVFIFEDSSVFKRQVKEINRSLRTPLPLEATSFKGKELETALFYPDGLKSRKLLLVGLGKSDKLTLEKLRRAAATASKSAGTQKAQLLALVEPDVETIGNLEIEDLSGNVWEAIGCALAEGAVLSLYEYRKYFTDDGNRTRVREVRITGANARRTRLMEKGVNYARIVCEGTILARDLENAPGNEIYPETLAKRAAEAGRKAKMKVTVFKEDRIKRLKMGGLIGVSQGSEKGPRFIIMEYNRARRGLPTVVLVGKGVTFDSGGISIKPSQSMALMKMDMSGAAAVIGAMYAAARLKLPVHLVGLIPATENLLSGKAFKPGDILRHYNGKTSEIDNTDAEGRLILADALGYAERYKPDVVIDLATLTGACVVALGPHATGMMGNDQPMMDRLKESGDRTYERVWQLPMFDEYEKMIKSDVADVKNVGGKWAGAITAAMFLKKFIGNYRWVHLDIAGTAIMEESLDYIPKGGSGVGVRLLADFLRHWNSHPKHT